MKHCLYPIRSQTMNSYFVLDLGAGVEDLAEIFVFIFLRENIFNFVCYLRY